MNEPTYVPESSTPLATDQKLDKILAYVANTSVDVAELKHNMQGIRDTVDSHTATLDAISKNTQNWEAEKAALTGRMNRHEEVIKRLAIKTGLKLDWPEPLRQ